MYDAAVNVDYLALLADRMLPGIKISLNQIPERDQEFFTSWCDENQMVDIVLVAKHCLNNIFGGISL